MTAKSSALKEAKEQGQKHYHGRPCKNCKETLKFTINQSCVACTKKRASTAIRGPEVYKKYIKSEKGQKWLKDYRHSETYRSVQNKWKKKSGFSREQQARRRKQIADTYESLLETEKQALKDIYAEAAKLSCETGITYHVDHIKPLFEGGAHHPDNLQIMTDEEHWIKCAIENKRRALSDTS